MPRSRELILGTAGHIDHGKTALIKALTGVDCDRLPEEKSRGITIDIGFAKLDLGDVHLGIVDVPGHERFIRNMLAGATGIDLALFIVAADDSVMPQTREHLEILKLLGLTHGVIAVTKCDLVDDTAREVVVSEVRDLVADSFLANAPIVLTSVETGEGLDQLRKELQNASAESRSATPDSRLPFRLSIDRAFVMQGHGTVVTGTVASGSLRVGDEVEWLPRQQHVRVRGLHHHGEMVEEVHRGMRAAINLAGVDHSEVQRGQELAAAGYLIPSRTHTVSLSALPDAHRPLKHRLPVRLHIGTTEVMGTLALLAADTIAPGDSGFAQLFLEEPVMAVWHQPFVLRGSSAETTLGGGRVLQPVARKLQRNNAQTIEQLIRIQDGTPLDRFHFVGWAHGSAGFSEQDIIREAGIEPEVATNFANELLKSGDVIELRADGARHLVHKQAFQEIQERINTTLGKLHAAEPLVSAHDRAKVQSQLDYLGDDSIIGLVIDRMLAEKKLVAEGRRIARADFQTKLTGNQRTLKDKIVAAHLEAGFQPPEPASFAPLAPARQAASLYDVFAVAVAEGLLVRISDGIYLHANAEAEMRRRVRAALAANPSGLTVAAIRDLLETTRKYAVPLCEYLDRIGITKRNGDFRTAAQESAATLE